MTFNTAKTEAVLLTQRKGKGDCGIRVGDRVFPFNKQATRWLGVWRDPKLTLKEHRNVRIKKAGEAQGRLRRLVGQAACVHGGRRPLWGGTGRDHHCGRGHRERQKDGGKLRLGPNAVHRLIVHGGGSSRIHGRLEEGPHVAGTTHGLQPGSYDAECAALARALRTAAERAGQHQLGTVTIWRMTSDDPGPGQTYSIRAGKHISTLRHKPSDQKSGSRSAGAGIEKADEWAKLAAGEPDSRGRVAPLPGPPRAKRSQAYATPDVACQPETCVRGGQMERSQGVVVLPNQPQEIQARQETASWPGCGSNQEAGIPLLPTGGGAHPHRRILVPGHQQPVIRTVLVVRALQHQANSRAPLQKVPAWVTQQKTLWTVVRATKRGR